jgi:hypothetical protein
MLMLKLDSAYAVQWFSAVSVINQADHAVLKAVTCVRFACVEARAREEDKQKLTMSAIADRANKKSIYSNFNASTLALKYLLAVQGNFYDSLCP